MHLWLSPPRKRSFTVLYLGGTVNELGERNARRGGKEKVLCQSSSEELPGFHGTVTIFFNSR